MADKQDWRKLARQEQEENEKAALIEIKAVLEKYKVTVVPSIRFPNGQDVEVLQLYPHSDPGIIIKSTG